MTMRILYYNEGENPAEWLPSLKTALPEAEIRLWQPGDKAPADYALVWNPPASLFQNRTGLKAIFNLAAGVDSLLAMSHAIDINVPIFRLEDAEMAIQMAEYVTHAVLRYYRRFDEYEKQAGNRIWEMLTPYKREDFTIGIMGMGIMGTAVGEGTHAIRFSTPWLEPPHKKHPRASPVTQANNKCRHSWIMSAFWSAFCH